MRYLEREDVINALADNPQGLKPEELTRYLFPDREGYEFNMSRGWVKIQLTRLKKSGVVYGIPSGDFRHSCYWRLTNASQ